MPKIKTDQKGQIAQLKVEVRAAERGAIVSRPTIPARYDALIDEGGKILRAQIKYADGRDKRSKNSIVVKTNSKGQKRKSRPYSSKEIDIILVYLPCIDKVIRLEPKHFDGKESIYIRIKRSRVSNQHPINYALQLIW